MRWRQRFFHRKLTEEQLDAELQFHLDQQTAYYIGAGMKPEEARRCARLEFGGLDQVKEECREVGAAHVLESMIQDVRFGLRQLGRIPGFTAVAVLTLGLGLAAVSTIFAVVETVLLRPLDYPHQDRIVAVSQNLPVLLSGPAPATLGEFQRWQQSGVFESATAIDSTDTAEWTLLGKGRPEQLSGVRVTPDFFRVFGIQPLLGRGFDAADATPGHDNVIVLSYLLWKRAFGGDPHVVGQSIRIREGPLPMTVIGVMPPRFNFPRLADVRTTMLAVPEQTAGWRRAGFQALRSVGENEIGQTLRRVPGIDDGCTDALEIPGVSRNNDEIVGKGGGRNQ